MQCGQAVIPGHGLACTGRDVEDLAAPLSARRRVICLDTIGPRSGRWNPDPAREYCLASDVKLAVALADGVGPERFHWVDMSMGGAIGIAAAAGLPAGRMRRLVVNNSGPQRAPGPVQRSLGHARQSGGLRHRERTGEVHFRAVHRPYGLLTDVQWRRLMETSVRRLPDGRVTSHYDPAMVRQFVHHPRDGDR